MKRITLLGLFICFATAVISCSKTELAAPEPPARGNGDDTQTEDTTTTPLPPEEKPAYTVINQATEMKIQTAIKESVTLNHKEVSMENFQKLFETAE